MSFDLWTFGFQATNVLLLVWLLHRFFWKPVVAIVAARQTETATQMEISETKRAEAEKAMAKVETLRKDLLAERSTILAAARKDAEAVRDAVLATAQGEARALHDTAEAARVHAAEALQKTARDDALALALIIAARLVSRLDTETTDAAFLGWLKDGLESLSNADRKVLAGAELKVISATEQTAAAQGRIAEVIGTALGNRVSPIYRTDPELIAGHELRSPHFTLRNSWQADLARIGATVAMPAAAREGGNVPHAA